MAPQRPEEGFVRMPEHEFEINRQTIEATLFEYRAKIAPIHRPMYAFIAASAEFVLQQ